MATNCQLSVNVGRTLLATRNTCWLPSTEISPCMYYSFQTFGNIEAVAGGGFGKRNRKQNFDFLYLAQTFLSWRLRVCYYCTYLPVNHIMHLPRERRFFSQGGSTCYYDNEPTRPYLGGKTKSLSCHVRRNDFLCSTRGGGQGDLAGEGCSCASVFSDLVSLRFLPLTPTQLTPYSYIHIFLGDHSGFFFYKCLFLPFLD